LVVISPDRLAIIAEANHVWGELRDAAYALSDEQIDRPETVGTWSGRDVMIHIANWEERCAEVIRDLDANRQITPVYTNDAELDAWNEAHVAPYRSVPLAEAKAYFEAMHAQLMDLVRTSPSATHDLVLGCYPGHLDDLIRLRVPHTAPD
jgi:hypothetical protein